MIDSMGRLAVPLYHGTSSYFLAQIREHGLGGFRDSKLFDAEILANLAHALDNTRNSTEWWEFNDFIVRAMLEQRVSDGGFNFRYGYTYLTPSKSTAHRYATSNRLGSEFLTTIYQAYMALASINPVEAENIVPNSHCLRTIFQETHRPVILTLKNVAAGRLRTEQGNPIYEQLNQMISMRDSVSNIEPQVLWQQFNFELEGSIDWSHLDFSLLDD
ncbi:hypothetical protein [Pseudohongiella sp.]|uniref:Uncharacterized protein n=1 Tax=marine sediment metagenome TaxID=412755 RepID=A0A0F9YJE1_9ZZZZ|nr:hypothetical protein [Pseudohongiella sp.]HDZ07500.1 hypothetical protein [Pseudohongiella sp.]HEA62995.1 hypothetical protein [Pseudohongiella sp.]